MQLSIVTATATGGLYGKGRTEVGWEKLEDWGLWGGHFVTLSLIFKWNLF